MVTGARENNLKDIDVSLPARRVDDGDRRERVGQVDAGERNPVPRARAELYRAADEPGAHTAIDGIDHIDKVIQIDQSPIGRTPRSNPATYTGLFTFIRELFAMLPDARRAATGRAGSRSTSKAAAARRARATA